MNRINFYFAMLAVLILLFTVEGLSNPIVRPSEGFYLFAHCNLGITQIRIPPSTPNSAGVERLSPSSVHHQFVTCASGLFNYFVVSRLWRGIIVHEFHSWLFILNPIRDSNTIFRTN